MDNIEAIFDEIIEEANDGINLDGINVKFHTLDKTSLSGFYNDVPVLVIKNKKELINKLRTYVDIVLTQKELVKSKSNIKKCLVLLWSNACYEDFSKPNIFVDNRINFYINDDFLNKDIIKNNIIIKRRVEEIYKKTPYAFKASIKLENDKYYLPSISYGISNDTCYIFDIIKSKNSGSALMIEDKYDVNLLSLSLFIKELFNYGIGKIKVVSYLPMREKNSIILNNFTDLGHLFNNIIIASNPFECDEYMNVNICAFDGKSKVNFNELLIDKE